MASRPDDFAASAGTPENAKRLAASASLAAVSPVTFRLAASTALFILFLLIGFLGAFAGWQVYSATTLSEQIRQDIGVQAYVALRVRREIRSLFNDTVALSHYLASELAVQNGRAVYPASIPSNMEWLLKIKENYDQFRILDLAGREILRINQTPTGPKVVPSEALQDKSASDYFQQSKSLKPGQFYLSPFELNRERGEFERPLKPVVRALAPIPDPAGEGVLGLVAITLDARPIFEIVQGFFRLAPGEFHVVAENGEWILSPDGENQWSVELGRGETFPGRYAGAWAAMAAGEVTGLEFPQGNFVAKAVPISPLGIPKALEAVRAEYDVSGQVTMPVFYLVARLSPPRFAAVWASSPRLFGGIALGYFAAALFISYAIGRMWEGRLAAARKIEEQAVFSQTVLDTTMEAVLVMDKAGIIQSVNQAGLRIFGYREAELLGKKINRLIEAGNRGSRARPIDRFFETGGGKITSKGPQEVQGLAKDGHPIDLEVAIKTATIGGQRMFVGSLRDITKRKQAVLHSINQLKKYQAFLLAILNSTPDAIVRLTADGTILGVNRVAANMFGFSEAEVRGRRFASLFSPSQEGGIRAMFSAAQPPKRRKSPSPAIHEFLARTRTGGEFPVEIALGALALDETAWIAVVRDVTARKDMEERLRQSQKMEAVGQLTGGIAHDFNNMLTSILGGLRMLEGEALGKDAREFLKLALESTKRAAELTKRLLAFGRRQMLEPKVVDVNAVLLGMKTLLRRTLGENIEIVIHPVRKKLNCLIDPGEFEGAVLNLCLNARDAMPKGGRLTIEISEMRMAEKRAARDNLLPGDYALITVTDTGTGMDEEVRKKALEPFFTTKKVGEGTGLGLSMVFGFVGQSGGLLNIYSEVGVGTSVKIYLPVSRGEAVSARPSGARMPAGRRKASKVLAGKCILLVEDDPGVREIARRALQGQGVKVLLARDAGQAERLIGESERIDLLLTDVVIPGDKTGFDLGRVFRQKFGPGRVLYSSGYPERVLRQDEGAGGAGEMLPKPYEVHGLLAKVEALLNKAPSRRGK